jgi:hypothetical protein
MSTWVTTVAPLIIALLALTAQIYFNFVPDVEVQKQQLKKAALWACDILTFGVQGVGLYLLTQNKGPVTPGFVVRVAFALSGLTFCAILVMFRRLMGGVLDRHLNNFGHLLDNTDKQLSNFGRHLDQTGQHIAITGQLKRAVVALSNDPNLSPDTIQTLGTIFDSPPDAPEKMG